MTRFGASASPVPRARALLAQRGLVVSRPGAGLGREDVLVVGGGQAALSTAMRAVAQPGDPVLLEAPTYPGTLAAARAAGLRTVSLPVDAHGMRPDYLDDGIPPVKPLALLETDGTVIHIRSLARWQTALTQRRRLAIRTVVETLGADVLPDHPRGGYHLWLRLPRGTDESEFLSAALARGTALATGTYFHADQPDVPRVRLSYAAAPTTADLVTGIHRLEGLV